eukprot:3612980-Amphidinium_carterae.1
MSSRMRSIFTKLNYGDADYSQYITTKVYTIRLQSTSNAQPIATRKNTKKYGDNSDVPIC